MNTKTVIAAALLVGIASQPALAQSARDNFSYSAPSGHFGEGTTKWNMYRFMHEDRERTLGVETTGSIQGSATGTETVRRPGERGRRPTR